MKKLLTLKSGAWALFMLAGLFLFSACEKIPGHTISTTGTTTTVTKAGNVSFILDDTTHIISTTSLDTVSFNSTSTPNTTITAKNGAKYLGAVISFNANTVGTFVISSATFTEPLMNGGALITSTNSGTVTVTAINATGGLLTGTFSCTVKDSVGNTVTLTGTFNIQQ